MRYLKAFFVAPKMRAKKWGLRINAPQVHLQLQANIPPSKILRTPLPQAH